jgi:hypothetical protein
MCRAEIIRWVTESKRSFVIVKDRGFQSLMKTGRPADQIPSPATMSRDVKTIFVKVCKRIAKMLQVCISFDIQPRKKTSYSPGIYPGIQWCLNFAPDEWTSPNNKAYTVITVHFKKDGVPASMLLDLVEVTKSHSGLNLAAAFAKILDDFGISEKAI